MVHKVEIISKETIKPSSPTPHHLRNHKLSLLDQIAPSIFIPLIFFYQHDQHFHSSKSRNDCVHSLKQSLSQILTMFYPLAGRFGQVDQNSSFVDCDDSGVDFTEARVYGHDILNVLGEPNVEELNLYLPFNHQSVSPKIKESTILAVKVSFFDYGGISIGICMSHKIGDGTSIVAFMTEWAKLTASISQSEILSELRPSFELASFFPPRDGYFSGAGTTGDVAGTLIAKEILVTKRFVFSKEMLRKLKNDVDSSSRCESQVVTKDTTKVEALSAFIWRCFMQIEKARSEKNNLLFIASHSVNLRARTTTLSCPKAIFGNFYVVSKAISSLNLLEDEGISTHDLAAKLRASIRNVDGDYIKENECVEYLTEKSKILDLIVLKGAQLTGFTSWCRFPTYEVDFGWGRPVWVGTATFPYNRCTVFMDTPCGEGIEAWVNLFEDDMTRMVDLYSEMFMVT